MTQKDYDQKVLEVFQQLSDKKYKKFNEALIPGENTSYGVRVPQIRSIAKEIIKGDWRSYLKIAKDDSFEEIMLQGMVIAISKCDIEEKLFYVQRFVPKIKNWAICDVFCAGVKQTRKNKDRVKEFLQTYIVSDKEFHIRFAVVMLLDYYVDDEHIDYTLNVLQNIRNDGYYVKMAVAWAISVCFIKQRDKTLPLIQSKCLDAFIQNKSIQKIRESYRVSIQDKDMIVRYKIK